MCRYVDTSSIPFLCVIHVIFIYINLLLFCVCLNISVLFLQWLYILGNTGSNFSRNFGSPEKDCFVIVKCLELHFLLLGLLCLLWQKYSLDVGQYTSLGDGDSGKKFVQFLVVPDGQLQMAGDDAALLVVASGVACQLEHLGGQVLHDGGQVDGCAGTNALAVVALPQQTMDPADGEL